MEDVSSWAQRFRKTSMQVTDYPGRNFDVYKTACVHVLAGLNCACVIDAYNYVDSNTHEWDN